MERAPKSQVNNEGKSPEKLTRRKFLEIVGGALAASLGGKVEKAAAFIWKEAAMDEREWFKRVTVIPETHRQVVIEAYQSLPPKLQVALRIKGIEVTFKDGEILGAAAALDQFGLDIDVHSVYVRWPAGAESVSFPWGKIRLVDATRHEIAHIALERIFSKSSKTWVDIIKAIQDEGPEFLEKVTAGHKGAASLYSPSSIAHYEALHEYLASLVEHCGKPLRVPLPSGRARPMVEALVSGGACTN